MKARVEEIFHELADLPWEERSRYFRDHEVDEDTKRQIRLLLEFDIESGTIPLEEDIAYVAREALTRMEPRGMLCGPYRLQSLLGSGGMGSVYLAERVDGEVAQRVAVKLLQAGASSRRVHERFLAERQILANLSHPNVARLLDAGRREDGQPYLVMEYVEGKPIDIYAAEFSIGSKVRLFLKVCAAVGYLHRNLVIHRDLKPGNILVTAEGEPKLLDFGIAKILDLMNDSAVTAVPVLTPDYASPEQVIGRASSTATDIYSLGAVLYKLLTGVSPHRFLDESLHAVVSEIRLGRITPPRKLAPAVRPDLDIIVLKLLRKEPLERYSSVEQLVEDLESYLQSRPIRARRGDTWYQIRKFLQRQWLPVATGLVAIAGLSGGLMVANRERAVAQQRFLQVRQLANRFIDLHDDVAQLPGSTKLRERMVTTAVEYLHNLSLTPGGDDARLLSEIGRVYEKVAHAQGAPGQPNLGRAEDALDSFRKAVQFESRAASLDAAYRIDAAFFRTELSYLAMVNGYFAEARQNLEAAADSLRLICKNDPQSVELLTLAARVAGNRGDLSELEGDYRGELRFFQDAAALQYEYLRRKPSNAAQAQAYRATTLVAWALADNKRYEEALATLRSHGFLIEALLAAEPENPNYLRQEMAAANYEGEIYDNETGNCLGKPVEAVHAFRRYVEIAGRLTAADPNNAAARLSLASAYYKLSWPLGKIDRRQSVRVAEEAVRLLDRDLARHPHDRVIRSGRARALRHLAYAHRRNGSASEARAAIERAIAAQQQVVNESPTDKHEQEQLTASRQVLSSFKEPAVAVDARKGRRLLSDKM